MGKLCSQSTLIHKFHSLIFFLFWRDQYFVVPSTIAMQANVSKLSWLLVPATDGHDIVSHKQYLVQ